MATKKFYSEDGTTIRVCHPDGSVALIGEEPREIPKKMWRLAVREGALASDMKVQKADLSEVGDGDDAETRRQAIYDAMLKAWDANESDEETPAEFEGAFTAAGVPNVRWIEKFVGFDIDAKERDEIWQQVQDENGEDESESEAEAD